MSDRQPLLSEHPLVEDLRRVHWALARGCNPEAQEVIRKAADALEWEMKGRENLSAVVDRLNEWASRGDGFGSWKKRTDEENNGYAQAVDEVAVILGLATARRDDR